MTAIAHTVGALGGRVLQADVDASGLRCLAVFGAPVGREDDAARAVACASELVAAHPEPASGSRREPPSAGWWAARCGSTTRCSATS